jgi:hypothetical protein
VASIESHIHQAQPWGFKKLLFFGLIVHLFPSMVNLPEISLFRAFETFLAHSILPGLEEKFDYQ